jgi:hypothetical protein
MFTVLEKQTSQVDVVSKVFEINISSGEDNTHSTSQEISFLL